MSKQRLLRFKSELVSLLGKYSSSVEFELFFSALIDLNPFNSTEAVREWLGDLNQKQYFSVEEIPFTKLEQWHWDQTTGDLRHQSGRFFSIRGCEVLDSLSGELLWDQPIIDQPEIGVLGILCQKIGGVLYLLMQAKAEPGNINTYQISPTVQATRSNYLQVHGGRQTRYLEYFIGQAAVHVICDQFQSEQGARFLGKRNRNIMVLAEDGCDIQMSDNHLWLTLGQLKSLMETDNTLNMDSRSIISQIDYRLPHGTFDLSCLIDLIEQYRDLVTRSDFWLQIIFKTETGGISDLVRFRDMLTWNRYLYQVDRKLVPLRNLSQWEIGESEINHKEGKYFQVLAVRIQANNREVDNWDQPIIRQRHDGTIGLLCARLDGVWHFLTQMKLEPGLYDLVEFAPTVQCIAENHSADSMPRYLEQFAISTPLYAARQSEEGGRFYRECSLNQICLVNQALVPEKHGYAWLTLAQLKQLVQFQQLINVELRSLLAYF